MELIPPEWKPRHTRTDLISRSVSSFKPTDLMSISPILLLSRQTASRSSPGVETEQPKIDCPLVIRGCHFLIKSYGYLPDVALFSSDLTHMAISPFTEQTMNPLLNLTTVLT